jgi:PAS domain-containing protein
MEDHDKTKDQLLSELKMLRKKVAEFEYTRQLRDMTTWADQQAELFGLFHEHLPVAYQSLDENGCFLEVNQEWLNALGYEREEVIGKCFRDFLTNEGIALFDEKFHELKSSGEKQCAELDMARFRQSHFLW